MTISQLGFLPQFLFDFDLFPFFAACFDVVFDVVFSLLFI